MSVSSSLQQMAGGVAAVVAGLIVREAPTGALLHFDTLGYLLTCTTAISAWLMSRITRRVAPAPALAPANV